MVKLAKRDGGRGEGGLYGLLEGRARVRVGESGMVVEGAGRGRDRRGARRERGGKSEAGEQGFMVGVVEVIALTSITYRCSLIHCD